MCYNAFNNLNHSQSTYVCDQMSQQVTCQLPPLLGVDNDVVITSGHGAERAGTNASRTGSAHIGLSTGSPRLTRLASQDCRADQPLSLSHCPINRTFSVSVCASSDSVVSGDELPIMIGGRALQNCSSFRRFGQPEFCATCLVLTALSCQSSSYRRTACTAPLTPLFRSRSVQRAACWTGQPSCRGLPTSAYRVLPAHQRWATVDSCNAHFVLPAPTV